MTKTGPLEPPGIGIRGDSSRVKAYDTGATNPEFGL